MEDFHLALIEESARRSGVIWITMPGAADPRIAWHIWHACQGRRRPGDAVAAGGTPGDTDAREAGDAGTTDTDAEAGEAEAGDAEPGDVDGAGDTAADTPPGDGTPPGAAYVITGGTEQHLPGLLAAAQVTVTAASKDSGGQLISWLARVSRVEPGSPEWIEITSLLASRRQGGGEPRASLPVRWAREAALVRLTPVAVVTAIAADPASAGQGGGNPPA